MAACQSRAFSSVASFCDGSGVTSFLGIVDGHSGHINDKDEIIIPVPGVNGDADHIIIIMGRPNGDETDRAAWYCEKCVSLLHMSERLTGRQGFDGFWRWELEAVRTYNSDIRHRTCWNCGHVNPLGYTAFHSQDTPETREARRQW